MPTVNNLTASQVASSKLTGIQRTSSQATSLEDIYQARSHPMRRQHARSKSHRTSTKATSSKLEGPGDVENTKLADSQRASGRQFLSCQATTNRLAARLIAN